MPDDGGEGRFVLLCTSDRSVAVGAIVAKYSMVNRVNTKSLKIELYEGGEVGGLFSRDNVLMGLFRRMATVLNYQTNYREVEG